MIRMHTRLYVNLCVFVYVCVGTCVCVMCVLCIRTECVFLWKYYYFYVHTWLNTLDSHIVNHFEVENVLGLRKIHLVPQKCT